MEGILPGVPCARVAAGGETVPVLPDALLGDAPSGTRGAPGEAPAPGTPCRRVARSAPVAVDHDDPPETPPACARCCVDLLPDVVADDP